MMNRFLLLLLVFRLPICATNWTHDVQRVGSCILRQDGLLELNELYSRYPDWWQLFPDTFSTIQKIAEKKYPKGNFLDTKALLSFFKKNPPLTVDGWLIAKKITKNNELTDDWVKKIWLSTSLSQNEQDYLLKHIQQSLHKKRVIYLLWNNQRGAAEALLKKLSISKKDPLWIACRLLEKKANVKDRKVLEDWHQLCQADRQLDLVRYGLVRFFIRENNVEKAASYYKSKLSEDSTSSDFLKKAAEESLEKVSISLIRSYLYDYNLKNGQRKLLLPAKKTFFQKNKGSSVGDLFPNSWTEKIFLGGLISLCLKDYQQAAAFFLFVAEFPKPQAATLALFENIFGYTSKDFLKGGQFYNLELPKRNKFLHRAKNYFWAGICYEQLGNKAKATHCFKMASRFPFFFYGQLALAKLGLPMTMNFSKISAEEGFSSASQKMAKMMTTTWIDLKSPLLDRGLNMKIAKDLVHLVKTDADARNLVQLMKKLDPKKLVFIAKQLASHPDRTFLETYPMPKLPIPSKDPAMVYAMMLAESSFNPLTISSAGAEGVMQIMPSEAAHFAKLAGVTYTKSRMQEFSYGAILGITELAEKLQWCQNLPIPTISAYNAGMGRTKEWLSIILKAKAFSDSSGIKDPIVHGCYWIESVPYEETRNHITRVLENRAVYRSLLKNPIYPKEVLEMLRVH